MISPYALENGRIAIKRARHGLMMFNRHDLFIGRAIDRYGEWCEGELDLVRPAIRQGDVVLDVGANLGTHALAFARMVGPTGTVIAFEPQPLVFNILAANAALNGADQLRCLNAAAGSGGGTINVPRTPPDQPANFGDLHLRQDNFGPADIVPLIAIDDLSLQSCRLIKADVQGMEAEVLRSATDTIARLRPMLYVECETVEQAPELIGMILGFGYDLYWHFAPYFSPTNFFDSQDNVFANLRPAQNLICVPSEQGIPVNNLDPCQGVEDNCIKALRRMFTANGWSTEGLN